MVDQIRRRGIMSVAQMVRVLEAHGFQLTGRASKVVSDALRWEVRRGRVERIERGVYRYRGAPPSTARRIRIFAERCRAWILATMRAEEPPPTPPDQRYPSYFGPQNPGRAPWYELGWLWTS